MGYKRSMFSPIKKEVNIIADFTNKLVTYCDICQQNKSGSVI